MKSNVTLMSRLLNSISNDLQTADALTKDARKYEGLNDEELAAAREYIATVKQSLSTSNAEQVHRQNPPRRHLPRHHSRPERSLERPTQDDTRTRWSDWLRLQIRGATYDAVQSILAARTESLALWKRALDKRYEKETSYIAQNRHNPGEPTHFYACRALAQQAHSLASLVRFFPAEQRQQALAILVRSVDAIEPIAARADRDRDGCLAYHTQGLLWIAETLEPWCAEEVVPLAERAVTAALREGILRNRIDNSVACLELLTRLQHKR